MMQATMFEGKHIHYSPIDQKPLCSFSSKLCRQRRLNGFAFCIRHILEDPSAPFQFCSFVAPPGQNKCTNVISMGHPKGLCNTHLQLAGFPAAKRDRRPVKKENAQLPVTSSPNGKGSVLSNEPTSSSMDLSDGDPYTFSDDTEPIINADSVQSGVDIKHKACNSTDVGGSIHNSPLAVEPLTPSSTSSSSADGHAELNILCKKSFPAPPPVVSNGLMKLKPIKAELPKSKVVSLPSKKRKTSPFQSLRCLSRLPPILQQLDGPIRNNKVQYLLPTRIEESDEEKEALPLSRHISATVFRRPVGPGGTPRAVKLERSQKELRHRYLTLAKMMSAEEKFQGERQASSAGKLVEAARRFPTETGLLLQGRNPFSPTPTISSRLKIFSRKRCSFRRGTADSGCPEFCLPCSTLCSRHILYSVDQQLFEFCSARGAGPTPCGAPVLAIHSGLPFCPAHLGQAERIGSTAGMGAPAIGGGAESSGFSQDGACSQQSLASLGSGSGKNGNRRKSRSRSTSSLGRHSRRLRNRRRAKCISSSGGGTGSETRIHCVDSADNGMELDVETVDSPENCSPAYPTPAQLIPHNLHTGSISGAVVPMVSNSVDHEVEILEDHDLKELLNRLPDEAFQEIFAMTQAAASSSRNGLFVPSREEAEELERALAVEGVPIPIMDKYSGMGGMVGHAGESDLSDLSLIDDHALALAHDLMALGGTAAAQNLLMANSGDTVVVSSNNSSYMDSLSIPHPSMMHSGYNTEASVSSSPMLSRRKSLSMIPSDQQPSPAHGSSPPIMNHHQHQDHHNVGTLIEERGGAAQS